MPASRADLFALFSSLGIETVTRDHAAVYTVEEASAVWDDIPGVHCKNLFLRDHKKRTFLLVVPHDREIDLKTLPEIIGSGRLSFGSADRLGEMLGVVPGSVTPFALINDREAKAVTPILDGWMMTQPLLNFHPLENTATTTIKSGDLLTFIQALGYDPAVITL